MIFYFSGTGNSQIIAKQLAEKLNDKLISINRCIKENISTDYFCEKPIIIVCPTYAWRIPKVVEKWIIITVFNGNQDVYFVMTCGGNVANANKYNEQLIRRKGLTYRGLISMVMPENYLALFQTHDVHTCQKLVNQALLHIDEIVSIVEKGMTIPCKSVHVADKIRSGFVNNLFYPLVVKDKGFRVTDQCIACGKCERVCPLNNINMFNNKPNWLGNCTHCMGCIACCPVTAIEYKKASVGMHRHFILDEE